MWRQLIIALSATTVVASTASAQSIGSELRSFLLDEATTTIHFRSYFFDRTNTQPPNNVAWAGGGWIGYRSGWLFDVLQLGAVGYTTQPIWAPQTPANTSDGTLLLKPGGNGFFALGQAFASARWQGQAITVFRQYIDELEVNPHDNRMVPQTFEAYALRGSLGRVSYFAGYVAAMKPRAESAFLNMAEVAGAPNANAGMALLSAKYGSMESVQLRASAYLVPDILWSSYGDVGGTIPLKEDLQIRLAGQLAVQGSDGLDLLTGRPFTTFWGGVRADAIWGLFALRLSFTQIGASAAWRSPYGIFIGYNKMQSLDFNRAGETAVTVGATYDLKGVGLPGLALLATATYGVNAVEPTTGDSLSDNREFDLELAFRADALSVPDWLKPLQLRNRVAFVDRSLGATLEAYTEYRIQLNYELTWKGTRRR